MEGHLHGLKNNQKIGIMRIFAKPLQYLGIFSVNKFKSWLAAGRNNFNASRTR